MSRNLHKPLITCLSIVRDYIEIKEHHHDHWNHVIKHVIILHIYFYDNNKLKDLISVLFIFIYLIYNYTLYKNPGFWLVNSRCIFRAFSYLGLISFIFTTVGLFAWGFKFSFSFCAVVFVKTYFIYYPRVPQNRLSAREIFRLSTGIFFRKYPSQTWYLFIIYWWSPVS